MLFGGILCDRTPKLLLRSSIYFALFSGTAPRSCCIYPDSSPIACCFFTAQPLLCQHFNCNTIYGSAGGAQTIDVVDLDNDCDKDILTSNDRLVNWFENKDGQGHFSKFKTIKFSAGTPYPQILTTMATLILPPTGTGRKILAAAAFGFFIYQLKHCCQRGSFEMWEIGRPTKEGTGH